jgi:hypothetical protein
MTPDETLSHVESLLRDNHVFRSRLVALMVRAGLYHARSAVVMQRAHAASCMLDAGSRRNDAQLVLRERYGISRSTAYRSLEKALDIRQGTLF